MGYKSSNNSGGATQPKTGYQYIPLCRRSGFMKTEEAIQSKTRSSYKGTGKHNHWESAPSDDQANVHGWNPE